ncbi:MAG: Fic family protein [Acidobacteriota bacterium]|nr:Fic family protein [Acidobacteriota bacterium]
MTPRFTITNAITAALTQVERARGFLEAAQLSDDWLTGMQQRALVLEAHYSTHIEGTHLTLDQAEKLLSGEELAGVDPDDARELLNYRHAFELVAEYLGSGEPITEGLIREIHKRLVRGVRGDTSSPGEYRRLQNYVANSLTKEIIYTPPSPLEVPAQMADLVAWIGIETGVHPVLAAGIAQFQLVHIHPFVDGNGRTARLLSALYLYRTGYDFKRLFTISEYYDRDRTAYYRSLQTVRERDLDLTGWLEYFTQGLAIQLTEVQRKGELLIRQDVLTLKYRLSSRQKAAVGLALEKAFGIQDLEALFPGVNRRTLQRELKFLTESGLLVTRGATRNLSYAAASSV